MKSILLREKAPFLLTLLLALVAWGLTSIAERSLDSPLIEYRREALEDREGSFILCEDGALRNVTPDHTVNYIVTSLARSEKLDGLTFGVRRPIGSKAVIQGVRAHWRPPGLGGNTTEDCGSDFATFGDLPLQPRSQVVLSVGFSEAVMPDLYVERDRGAVILKRADLETFVVRHEIGLILTLISFAVALIVPYLGFLETSASVGEQQTSSNSVTTGGGDAPTETSRNLGESLIRTSTDDVKENSDE